ncbi:MAG: zinc ABC transporter substrate-binding protein [Rickettsiales bacterium]|nr:zinc ABC transporter substrate-binding protein [Rickettsiales bacterium]
MKKILLTFALFFVATAAEAKITIFACEPEWGSLARVIVKDAADINVAIAENQNAQIVSVKSALVDVARKAEMVFCSGGGLEDKWLPSLINRSYNLAAISNENSLMFAANYVAKPIAQKGARVHLNPHNILKIAAEFTRRVKLLDPIHATFYQKNHDEFAKKWQEAIPEWEKKAAPLKGLKFMANDNSWGYLADWLGLNIETIIDSRTGAKPDVLRLHAIADNLKTNPVEAIIFAGWEDKRSMLWLRDTAKTRVVLVPFTTKGPTDLFKLFDVALNALLTDCSSGVCKTLAKPEKTKVTLR